MDTLLPVLVADSISLTVYPQSYSLMDVLLPILVTAGGIAVLVFGGNLLIRGAVGISRLVGLSGFVVGMTVVAYGTSAPELAASIAALDPHPGMVLGNVAGSNVANVGMVAAVALILGAGFGRWRKYKEEFLVVVGCSAGIVLLVADGDVSFFDGAILLAAAVASTTILLHRHTKKREKVVDMLADRTTTDTATGDAVADGVISDNEPPRRKGGLAKSILMTAGGAGLLWVGAVFAVNGAASLGSLAGLSDHTIGITVIAVGTSLPELVTTIMAVKKKEYGIGLGNVIGSNIANILLIGGAAALLSGGLAAGPGVSWDLAIAAAFTIVFVAATILGKMSRVWGLVFVAAYVAWLTISLVA